MNIIQIQNQLKGLPDHVIAGYVQNPNAQVPPYLALSELQRRKTTREEFQQNQQAPQQSVAQSLTSQVPQPQMQAPQQGQPPQGINSLPMGPTPQPQQNFARGGIVAFANGGDVDAGTLTAQAEAAFEAGDYEKAKALYAQSASIQEKINAGDTPTMAPQQIDQARAQINDTLAQSRPTGIYTLDENLPVENIPEAPKGLPALTAPDFVLKEDKTAGPRESDVKRIRERDKRYEDYPNGDALRVADGVRNNALIGDDLMEKMKLKKAGEQQERIKGYKDSTAKSNSRLQELQAAKGLPAILPPKQTANVPTAQQAPQPVLTPLEKAQAEYRAALAPDQKTRGELTNRMEHLDAQSKWRREHTDSDAFIKAGLAMMAAGSKPGATILGSIGAGGEAGIKSLSDAADVQYATEEKRYALEQQLTQLERAERIAVAKFGVESEEAKMVRKDKQDVESRKNALDREIAKLHSDTQKETANIHAAASRYGADKHAATQRQRENREDSRAEIAANQLRRQSITTNLQGALKELAALQYSPDEEAKKQALSEVSRLRRMLEAAGEGQSTAGAPTTPPQSGIPGISADRASGFKVIK